ncbi:MAG: branched-chain amino acid ABC transporter permease [Leucobacter sp.]
MLDGIVSGLVAGSSYAILAVCLVVLYRLVGVLNFAQAAIGALGAYTCYAVAGAGVPLAVAVAAGIAAAATLAGIAGWALDRWFANPTAAVRAVVSVVLLILVLALGFRLFGDSPRLMPPLVPGVSFAVAGVRVSLTTIVALLAAGAIAGGLSLVLRRTRLGLRLRALSERPVTLQLLGVNTSALAIGVWGATAALSTLALLLVAPSRNPTFESMSFLVVPALAAALLGRFSNVWIAAGSGLVIGAIEGAGARIPVLSDYRGALPFALIIAALVWLRRREAWDAAR